MRKSIKTKDGNTIVYHHHKKSDDTVLLLHGLGVDSSFWKPTKELFHKLGVSTIAIDLRGHGGSSRPKQLDMYELPKFAEDIDAILDKENIKKTNIIAHSFGGALAAIYHHTYPKKVNSIVFINADYKLPLIVRASVKTGILDKMLKRKGYSTEHHVLKNCVHQISAYTKDKKSVHSLLKSIKIPTLMIRSKRDELIPARHMKFMIKMMHGKLVNIPGHHNIIHEKPKLAHTAMIDFLLLQDITFANLPKASVLLLAALAVGISTTPNMLSTIAQGFSFQQGVTGAAVTSATQIISVGSGLSIYHTVLAGILLAGFYLSYKD
tara:strand:- start:10 stop:975 length:966 start_codon:yes stop_codon:yes gene_type:complete